jgi:hypothetical protein
MDELERRRQMGFLAAEGLELPQQLSGRDVTKMLRILLLELLTQTCKKSGHDEFRYMWLFFFERFGDDFPEYQFQFLTFLREYIENQDGANILALIQDYCRQLICTDTHFHIIRNTLEKEHIRYRLVGTFGDNDDPPTLMPVSTSDQADRLVEDYARLASEEGQAAQRHLRAAAAAISAGNFNASVRESIHAVESAAKRASGKPNATLPDALAVLERTRALHPALKKSLATLYGWTSDEKGIRHAEIGPTAEVPESMALFMLSSCTAFAGWLLTSGATGSSQTVPA